MVCVQKILSEHLRAELGLSSFLSLFENMCSRSSLSITGSYWLKYCRNGYILALKHCLCHLDCQKAVNSRGMLSEQFGCLLHSSSAFFLAHESRRLFGSDMSFENA